MPQRKGTGRVSYRGLLALGIGLVFIWFALNPAYFNEDTPPFFILIIMFLTGAGLASGGISSLRFVWKRSHLVRSTAPRAAEICVLVDDDSERNTETVHLRIGDRFQALGVDCSGAVHQFADGAVRAGEVWLDDTGRVYAIAIAGHHFNTLIGGHEIPADAFGVKT